MRRAQDAIADAIASAPVIDTHEHLVPFDELDLPMNFVRLVRRSYLTRSLRVSDSNPNGTGSNFEFSLEHDNWETAAAIHSRVRFTSYYRWLMRAVAELYGLAEPALSPERWEYLSSELAKRYANDHWLTDVLDKANISAVIWDPFWNTGRWRVPERRMQPSLRIDSSLVAFDSRAKDHDRNNVVRDWARVFDMNVDSLADLEALLEKLIVTNIEAGARSLKFAFAYDRTLDVSAPSVASARRVFGRGLRDVDAEGRKQFGDYVVHFFLERAKKYSLVVQVHTGMARLQGSNPLLLEPLLQQYPEIVFDLFHGGYPWVRESAGLAHNYPNVRLNLSWLPLLSTTATVQVLNEWLEIVPQLDRISWGGDCQTVEETYGALLAVKHALAVALGYSVEEGNLTIDEALTAAHSVLYGGGKATYLATRLEGSSAAHPISST